MPKIAITSGIYRGRKLETPSTTLTHPMGSREKLALFNALESLQGPLSVDSRVLDCFCGSGALGLEAISRGAGTVVFVDQNASAIAATKHNVAALSVQNQAKIIKSSAQNYADSPDCPIFDLILADPPYDNFPADLSFLGKLLKNDGILALSHPTSINLAQTLPGFDLIRTKKHAAANISFLVKHEH